MSAEPEIRPLRPGDAEAVAALRRRALAEAPLVFLASDEDDHASKAEVVRADLERPGGSRILGAFAPALVGCVGLAAARHRKASHKRIVWGLYVRPERRREGIAHRLLDAAVAVARSQPGVRRIELGVSDAAPGARRLYEQVGFRVWGVEPDALRVDGRSVAEHHMGLDLGAPERPMGVPASRVEACSTSSLRERWATVDAWLDDQFGGDDAALRACLAEARGAGLPEQQVSAAEGRWLGWLARSLGARRVLEIGTLAGYSTLWIARALPEDGCVVSLERDPRHVEVARRNIERAGLATRIDVVEGDAATGLAALREQAVAPFDLVFVDADKRRAFDDVEASLLLLRPGGVIVVDNVVREGALADAANEDPRVVGVRRLHEAVARDPRLAATTLQTVGAKGHDGMLLIRFAP